MSKQHLVAAFFLFQTLHVFAAAGDENWNQRFSSPISGSVRSIVARNGEIVAVGDFLSAGGVSASYATRWNGTNWSAINGLITMREIHLVTTNNSGVYIAGPSIFFGDTYPPVVKWDGTNIAELGTGLTALGDGISAMHGSGNDLYVAGPIAIHNSQLGVARWNGTNWQSLATQSPYYIPMSMDAIVTKGADMFLTGKFNTLGNASAANIARWNGTFWSALGTGLNGRGRSLAVVGNDLYVGGEFTMAGGVSANHIAKWNGTTWSALGSGLNGTVTTLTAIGTDLYAGGDFTSAGGTLSPKLAKWNGSSWSAVNVQVTGAVQASAALGTTLFVGGAIDSINNTNTGNIFTYTAGSARTIAGGVSGGRVNVLRTIGNDVYAGGAWRNLAGTNSAAIARFDGMNWMPLGTGLSDTWGQAEVFDILSRSNEVIVAGQFDNAGGATVTNVARWNGTNWQTFGSGLRNQVYALAQTGNELFAGGNFQQSSFQFLARLSGSNWVSVGASSPSSPVLTLASIGNTLYAGGYFTSWPVSGSSYLAKWNGTSWSAVGAQQLNGHVETLAVAGGNLYVGGYFTMIGSTTCNRIARWNGTSWSALGTGLGGPALSILPVGNDLYVGGWFTTAGGVPVRGIAKWNGTTWSALGSGVSGTEYPQVKALVERGNDLLAGGSFTIAGGLPSYNLASWRIQSPSLHINNNGASAVITWPAGFIPYQLQTATSLGSATWTNAPQTATFSNGTFSVATNFSASSQFFRLQQLP